MKNKTSYLENIKMLAREGKFGYEREHDLIKEMGRLTSDMLDFRYSTRHYKPNSDNSTVIEDNRNKIINSLAILISDLDIYMASMYMYSRVQKKKENRVEKLGNRIRKE